MSTALKLWRAEASDVEVDGQVSPDRLALVVEHRECSPGSLDLRKSIGLEGVVAR